VAKRTIPVYKREKEDGLAALVQERASVACFGETGLVSPYSLSERAWAALVARAQAEQPDLAYFRSILVTTGWNKNDDVFDRAEVWAARDTPEDKPLNYEHEFDDILGHITGNSVVDDDGQPVADGRPVEELPGKFHVVTAFVVYRRWHTRAHQERIDDLLQKVAAGEFFVSMECLFTDFDYALSGADGDRVIARNEETAFLTKRLRAFGGDGSWDGNRVGRVLRGITFSGEGLVRKPANPESVIFANFSAAARAAVYENAREIMNENEKKLTEDLKALAEAKSAAEAALAKSQADAKALADSLVAAQAALESTKAELVKSEGLRKHDSRKAALVKLGLAEDQASVIASSSERQTDEQFEAALAGWTTVVTKPGATSAPHQAVAPPPKATPAAVAPQATPAPAPPRAAGADFSQAQLEPQAALAADAPSDKTKAAHLAVASHFGYKPQEK
jgi:hypothetical protein